jgi:hypothetical protein
LNDGAGSLMLNGRYEPGAVAAIITKAIDIDMIIWIAGLIIDLEIDLATEVGAEGRREPLDCGGIGARRYPPDTLGRSCLLVL